MVAVVGAGVAGVERIELIGGEALRAGYGNGDKGRRGRGQGRGEREARGAAVRNPAWRRRRPSSAGVLAGAAAQWWR